MFHIRDYKEKYELLFKAYERVSRDYRAAYDEGYQQAKKDIWFALTHIYNTEPYMADRVLREMLGE